MNPTILALDLGTQTGWAIANPSGAITSGTQSFRPQRFEGGGMRYLDISGDDPRRELAVASGTFPGIK